MNETSFPPYSVSVGHGYFKHTRIGWRENNALRYHMFFIVDEIIMKDSVYYAYNRSFGKDGKDPTSRKVSKKTLKKVIIVILLTVLPVVTVW